MADHDFQATICSDNWWSSSRNMLIAVGGGGGFSPCSAAISDLTWPPADEFPDIKPKSTTLSDHNNSMLFQDYSTFQWNQSNNFIGNGGRGEGNLINSNGFESYNNQDYNMVEQSMNCSSTTSSTPTCQGLFHLDDSTLYGYPSSTKLLQSLYNDQQQQPPHGHSIFNSSPSINTNSTFPTNPNDLSLSSTPNFASNYIKPSQPQPGLLFPNNSPFWNNASTMLSSTDIADPKSQISSLSLKPIKSANYEDSQESKKNNKNSAATESAQVFKKPRIETPSPLPTFKVRKEKLGDRVTALQQLVSPFGKTDTASVLHEAIEYIKFLHDQLNVLSTPYMKSNNGIITPNPHQQICEKTDPDWAKQDLRSRGLCLVPISSTFPVTNAATAGDFWTPTFGGTFR